MKKTNVETTCDYCTRCNDRVETLSYTTDDYYDTKEFHKDVCFSCLFEFVDDVLKLEDISHIIGLEKEYWVSFIRKNKHQVRKEVVAETIEVLNKNKTYKNY
jgi:hypothetical protein